VDIAPTVGKSNQPDSVKPSRVYLAGLTKELIVGLDKKTEGNPAFKEQGPGKSLNPGGRPKGSLSRKTHPNVKERLLGKWQTHPVDRLVELANFVGTSNPELAVQIWTNLLKYFEPTKKPVESAPEKTTPEEAKEAAEETFKLLQEIENHGFNPTGSQATGVEPGTTQVPSETSAEANL
jgi:hypothetical protein